MRSRSNKLSYPYPYPVSLTLFLCSLGKEVKELERERSRLGVQVNPLQEQLTMLQGQVQAQEARLRDTAPDKKKVSQLIFLLIRGTV